jgi:hypothetical protein
MAPSDPFACFGDESDDDSDVADGRNKADDDSDGRERACQLMETFNTKHDKPAAAGASQTAETPTASQFQSSYADQQKRAADLPWPHHPPLYLGPMYLDTSLTAEGGGRGYVAAQDLPPGTCVLVEEPFVNGWSEQQLGKSLGLESIHHLLELEGAKTIVGCMEELHPRKQKVDDVFASLGSDGVSSINPLDRIQIVDMMASMEEDTSYCQDAQSLATLANDRGVTNTDGSPLTTRDISRLLLTMRYNGFDSGIYLHFAMFNHDEDPNCIKFRPTTQAKERSNQLHYSEARTTRYVRKGEALTLHYLENPREVSHPTRRRILWDQHRFDIGDEDAYKAFLHLATTDTAGSSDEASKRRQAIFESELVSGKFPQSTVEESAVNEEDDHDSASATTNIEKSLDDLEEMMVELQTVFTSKTGQAVAENSSHFDRAAALELTVGELITAGEQSLENNHHILLSRCRRLHLDAIEILLSHCSNVLTEKQSTDMMTRFLVSVQPLLESQRKRLGSDHSDVARTYHDFAMGIQALLSHSPKKLVSLKLDGMKTLDQCSKIEHFCRSEKERIERLYPRDVDSILASVNG